MRLGQRAKDKITGFEGILIGHADYLTGCAQYLILPSAKDGEYKEGHWLDEGRIEVLGDAFEPEDVSSEGNGADREAPKK
jgi:hypothetical protein